MPAHLSERCGGPAERLAALDSLDYFVTGSMAAQWVAACAPARLATIYVRDIDEAAKALTCARRERARTSPSPAATTAGL